MTHRESNLKRNRDGIAVEPSLEFLTISRTYPMSPLCYLRGVTELSNDFGYLWGCYPCYPFYYKVYRKVL